MIESNPQNENILAQFVDIYVRLKQEKEKHFAEDLISEVQTRKVIFR